MSCALSMSLVDHMPALLCSAWLTCQKCSSHTSGLLQHGCMEVTWHLCINFSWALPLDVSLPFENQLFQRPIPADYQCHCGTVAEEFECRMMLPCCQSNIMEVAHLEHRCKNTLLFTSAKNTFPINLGHPPTPQMKIALNVLAYR